MLLNVDALPIAIIVANTKDRESYEVHTGNL